jgi:hypothetical protein
MSSGSKGWQNRSSKSRPRPSALSEEGQIVTIIHDESDLSTNSSLNGVSNDGLSALTGQSEEDIQARKKPRNEEKTAPILKNFTKSHRDDMKKSIYVILEGSPVPNHVKAQSDLAEKYMRILLESEEAFRHFVSADKVRGVIREIAGSKTRSGNLIDASKTGVRGHIPTGASSSASGGGKNRKGVDPDAVRQRIEKETENKRVMDDVICL